ncbi:ATP synthase subunit I [Rhodoferax koreense]|uniref:ATP synthase subunit I n=2 Tax=Rhodoferax koreensis TaxID=1842727 RepID=A0A1P8K344_9BURK|nr:ATP synthase subunit I [Rhodoferax koreense]APW40430.1 ATP synthase subunit I [Rhodoferax koreense]
MKAEAEARGEDLEFKPEFKPLSAEEAQAWRQRNPASLSVVSLWRVPFWQAVVGGVVALAAWLFTGRPSVGWSAGYGALAVVVPAALFARGVSSSFMRLLPGGAMLGFFVWELVKIALTVAMLFAAPRLVEALSWLALLAGFVVTIKVYWLALVLHSRRRVPVKPN